MTSFISTVATEHFRGDAAGSLLKACLGRLDRAAPEQQIEAMKSDSVPLRSALVRMLRQRMTTDEERNSFCAAVLSEAPSTSILKTIGALPFIEWCGPGLKELAELWLRRALAQDDDAVRQAAAGIVAKQFPTLIPELIDRLERHADQSVARQLCFEGHPQTIEAVLSFDQTHRQPGTDLPPAFGLMLTSNWLAVHGQASLDSAMALAQQYGYVDASVEELPIDYLQSDIDFVNRAMLSESPAKVRSIVSELMWAILGQTDLELMPLSGGSRPNQSWNFDCEFDQGVLFAAARELDRSTLEHRRSLRVGHADPLVGAARFLHASAAHTRQVLLQESRDLANELGVPEEHYPEFILHRCAVVLEPDDDRRVEADLFLRVRWKFIGQQSRLETELPRIQVTDTGRPRFPQAARLIKPARTQPAERASGGLPSCSRAVMRLLSSFDHSVDSQWFDDENRLAQFLVPLGVEVQIPSVDNNLHVAWKELLVECGIPSPRRPECGRMLEAALSPAGTWHAPIEFLKWLPSSGILAGAQDLGIHVSLQGDLGDNARFLAFPQLFLTRPVDGKPRSRSGLRLVMSKGLVALNSDVRRCHWAPVPTCRTEFRTFIAGVLAVDKGGRLDDGIVDAIRETHLIGSAFLSSDAALLEIAHRFAADLQTLVTSLQTPFAELLMANYYEATGDPSDASLAEYLPVVRLREAVRPLLADEKTAHHLRKSLVTIRSSAASAIFRHIQKTSTSE